MLNYIFNLSKKVQKWSGKKKPTNWQKVWKFFPISPHKPNTVHSTECLFDILENVIVNLLNTDKMYTFTLGKKGKKKRKQFQKKN